ncbi:hypothetical protein AJ80_05527 [Polytolypa hystricis UAMH7299]|uniref:cellulase n=1 Tax=Polytolypa hystricis (strain UAMH7299) TaxID=1447883 RepID=A0A2B7Y2L9_POLH7|nr:hypothetical protein AJ80_05527 [Polytolypa hystricis UAMH7299]
MVSANILASLFLFLSASQVATAADNTVSGEAITERYWDCCKTDCAWPGRTEWTQPIQQCDGNNKAVTDFNAGSGCGDGKAFSCADQSPWAINDTFSYGYAGVYLVEQVRDKWCSACYEVTFTSGKVKGKKMVVQGHNSGFDLLTANKFALAIPGGNTSFAGACAKQYGVDNKVFGIEDEGVSTSKECENLPKPLQAGCKWRFDWFMNETRPNASYKRVKCPTVLTDRTKSIRNDDADIKPEDQDAEEDSASSITYYSTLGLGAFTALLKFIL